MSSVWNVIAAGTYWILVLLWTFIFVFCVHRLRAKRISNGMVAVLLIVLAIDALRTIVESVHFGLWYTSHVGYLPISIADFLARSDVVVYPKLMNVVSAIIIIFLVLRRWLPHEERELARETAHASEMERQVQTRTEDWEQAARQLELELDRRRVLMNELDHRVKNNLASVISVVQLSLSGACDVEYAQSSLLSRLHALSTAYSLLAECNWDAVSLELIVQRSVLVKVNQKMNVIVEGAEVHMAPSAVSSLGLIFAELTTNAVRHGALSHDDGSLRISWRRNERSELVLNWSERASHPIAKPLEEGFGLQLIRGLASHDLHGSLTCSFELTGFTATLTMPAEQCLPERPAGASPSVG